MDDFAKDPLWEKLLNFTFDQCSEPKLTFEERLSRENRWTAEKSQQAILEYKKFLYLGVRAGHPITPSDEVDQVWHLHLQYSRNYWHSLCKKTLGYEFHHGPTQGGQKERTKYKNWYEDTKESYEKIFGEVPPIEIWPGSKERFSLAPYFCRVNTKTHFVISKKDPFLYLALLSLGLIITGLVIGLF